MQKYQPNWAFHVCCLEKESKLFEASDGKKKDLNKYKGKRLAAKFQAKIQHYWFSS